MCLHLCSQVFFHGRSLNARKNTAKKTNGNTKGSRKECGEIKGEKPGLHFLEQAEEGFLSQESEPGKQGDASRKREKKPGGGERVKGPNKRGQLKGPSPKEVCDSYGEKEGGLHGS